MNAVTNAGPATTPHAASARDNSELGERRDLALDLGLDVERRLAGPGAAVVAGDDEVADLAAQAVVDRRGCQAVQLQLYVDRLLAAPLGITEMTGNEILPVNDAGVGGTDR